MWITSGSQRVNNVNEIWITRIDSHCMPALVPSLSSLLLKGYNLVWLCPHRNTLYLRPHWFKSHWRAFLLICSSNRPMRCSSDQGSHILTKPKVLVNLVWLTQNKRALEKALKKMKVRDQSIRYCIKQIQTRMMITDNFFFLFRPFQ